MVKRKAVADEVHLTFVLSHEHHDGKVSVVGDFNDWTPGMHTLMRRSNGTKSVRVTVPAGAAYRFRYLGEGGRWFDEADADAREHEDCVILT
jgi:1,4-alpha-glucan branching enzyme